MKPRTRLQPSIRRVARRGFTLVELLLVLVILGTLAALVLPRFAGTTERAKQAAAKTQISTFKSVIGAFEVDNGSYPKTLQDLIQQPRDAQGWHGPYLDPPVIPLDPWGRAYIYQYPGKHNSSGYDILSLGADGQEGSDDDINNWQQPTPQR